MTIADVSVIVPIYNRVDKLSRTVYSVLAQTYSRFELILVDDGSTDGSRSLAESFVKKDRRVRAIVNSRTKGAPGARNTGLYESGSDWVAFLDSDDAYEVDMLAKTLAKACIDPSCSVVTCKSTIYDEMGIKDPVVAAWGAEGSIEKGILSGSCYVDMNGALIKKAKLLQIGGLDEKCPSFQEWDLHIRLSGICRYAFVPESLVRCYDHAQQMSKDIARSMRGEIFVLGKHKALWKKTLGTREWYKRMQYLLQVTQGLESERLPLLTDLRRIEPLLPLIQLYMRCKSYSRQLER